jgi:chromosome segregation ATPase
MNKKALLMITLCAALSAYSQNNDLVSAMREMKMEIRSLQLEIAALKFELASTRVTAIGRDWERIQEQRRALDSQEVALRHDMEAMAAAPREPGQNSAVQESELQSVLAKKEALSRRETEMAAEAQHQRRRLEDAQASALSISADLERLRRTPSQ